MPLAALVPDRLKPIEQALLAASRAGEQHLAPTFWASVMDPTYIMSYLVELGLTAMLLAPGTVA